MSRAEKHILQTSLVRQVSDFRPFFAHPLLAVTTATSASAAPSPAIGSRVLHFILNTVLPHYAALRGERQQGMATLRLRRGCNGLEDEQAGETRLTDKSCKTSFRFRPFFAHPLLTVTTATSASAAPSPAIGSRVLHFILNTV